MMDSTPSTVPPPVPQSVASHPILRNSFRENMEKLLSLIRTFGGGFDSITTRNQAFDEMSDVVVCFLVIISDRPI
jgi:hypothetical protein